MPNNRSLTDDVLLEFVPADWTPTSAIHVKAGLAGHDIGLYQFTKYLRELVGKGKVLSMNEGKANLRWRRADAQV